MIEVLESQKPPELPDQEKPFLVIGHAYQPHRQALLPTTGERLDVVPSINEEIYEQVYDPVLVEGESIPQGLAFSFYPGLRDWLRNSHPSEYQKVIEKINAIPEKEYQVLGDPYIHLILPLLPYEDQDMLLKLGKRAFEEDLGFTPSGLWLPETGVSSETLDAALNNGYEFVVLRDNQLRNPSENPVNVLTDNGKVIKAVHFNSGLSGSLSFEDDVSSNADDFLDRLSRFDSDSVVVGSDIELYGHHKKDRDKFLAHLEKTETLRRHGYTSFDVEDSLKKSTGQITEVIEDSSWSCDHGVGRWTGECDCDSATEATRDEKRFLFQTLSKFGAEINSRLDGSNPDWRDRFIDFFLNNRDLMFNPSSQMVVIADSDRLFWAKYAQLIGMTSCGWFFGGQDTPERQIPRTMIQEIEALVPDIREHIVYKQ